MTNCLLDDNDFFIELFLRDEFFPIIINIQY